MNYKTTLSKAVVLAVSLISIGINGMKKVEEKQSCVVNIHVLMEDNTFRKILYGVELKRHVNMPNYVVQKALQELNRLPLNIPAYDEAYTFWTHEDITDLLFFANHFKENQRLNVFLKPSIRSPHRQPN
jgi:hypothetical protein